MDFSDVKVGDWIEFIGEGFAYGGKYKVYTAESTFMDPSHSPYAPGTLVIIEFTNSDHMMTIPLYTLKPEEWKFAKEEK